MIVYIITNQVDSKAYIGYSTKTVEDRWFGHLQTLREGSKTYLYNSMRKYGAEKFNIIPIWSGNISLQGLKELEKYYIKSFNTKWPNGYNMTDGGDGVSSEVLKELWKNPSYVEKMKARPKTNSGQFKPGHSSSRKNGHREDLSPETRLEMSRKAKEWQVLHGNKRTGVSVTEETRDKISRANKGKTAWNKGKIFTNTSLLSTILLIFLALTCCAAAQDVIINVFNGLQDQKALFYGYVSYNGGFPLPYGVSRWIPGGKGETQWTIPLPPVNFNLDNSMTVEGDFNLDPNLFYDEQHNPGKLITPRYKTNIHCDFTAENNERVFTVVFIEPSPGKYECTIN